MDLRGFLLMKNHMRERLRMGLIVRFSARVAGAAQNLRESLAVLSTGLAQEMQKESSQLFRNSSGSKAFTAEVAEDAEPFELIVPSPGSAASTKTNPAAGARTLPEQH